jgi:multiple sugar transport system substrate-binding protein
MSLTKNRFVTALPIVALILGACGGAATPAPATPPPATPIAATPVPATPVPATPIAATPVPATPPPATAEASASPATSAGAKDFTGVTVNVVTFTGPPIAEPLQRHGAEWEKATGGKVNVTTAPFSDLFQKEATDLATGTNSFTLYTMSSSWLGSFAGQGYFQDLTSLVPTYPGLQWDDVVPVMQSNSSFGGKIYAVPFDSDVLSVYYRTDILGKDGVAPPKTWDEYLTIAKKYQGKDLNGDGTPDYGSCIEKAKGGVGTWQFNGVFSGFVQALGTKQGTFFGDGLTPLVNNEAMGAALDFWKASSDFGPGAEINLDQGTGRGLMTAGRCALNIDWGDMGTLPLDPSVSKVKNKVGAVVMPGSSKILDRATGKLVPCDATLCPNAVDGINHAPFNAFGGWIGAINSKADPKAQEAALDFIAYVSAPEQSNPDVTTGVTGEQPFRISQQDPALWIKAGMTADVAKNFLDTYIGDSLNGPNAALDLRIPQANQYTNVLEDQAIAQFLAGELTKDEAMKQIFDGWQALTDQIGRDAQTAAYAASIGAK